MDCNNRLLRNHNISRLLFILLLHVQWSRYVWQGPNGEERNQNGRYFVIKKAFTEESGYYTCEQIYPGSCCGSPIRVSRFTPSVSGISVSGSIACPASSIMHKAIRSFNLQIKK